MISGQQQSSTIPSTLYIVIERDVMSASRKTIARAKDTEHNCMDCANDDNVQWCECCSKDYCSDCRLKEYRRDNDVDFCFGCKSLLCHKLETECTELRRQLDELQNQQNQPPPI